MEQLAWLTFEIDNVKKQMAVLFVVADEVQQNEMLEELKTLIDQRDKLIEEQKKKDE